MHEPFISYSGSRSKEFAQAVADAIKCAFPNLKPWLAPSSPGEAWLKKLDKALSSIGFGVLCLTSANLRSRWIHYEAGAIEQHTGTSRVVPFLWKAKISDLEYPLSKFNCIEVKRGSGIRKLLKEVQKQFSQSEAKNLKDVVDAFTETLNKIDNDIKNMVLQNGPIIGPDCDLHLRILRAATRSEEKADTVFRRNLALKVLEATETSLGEIANRVISYRSSAAYLKSLIKYVNGLGRDGSIRAICGHKPWSISRKFFDANVKHAIQTGAPNAVIRIFLEPSKGFSPSNPDHEGMWKVMLLHKDSEGCTARIITNNLEDDLFSTWPGLAAQLHEGFGFVILRNFASVYALAHLGKRDKFVGTIFLERATIVEIEALFEDLESLALEFVPNKWPKMVARFGDSLTGKL